MRVTILGGGSWGTALSAHLCRQGHSVRLWLRDASVAQAIRDRGENPRYLRGVALPAGIAAATRMDESLEGAEVVFLVVPSAAYRLVCREAAPFLPGAIPLVSATKGLEMDSLLRMSEVASGELPAHPVAVLSGPSFAREVAQGQPTAVVVASTVPSLAETLQREVSGKTFRAYASGDVVGVELAGALKNVIAIAAGIVRGLGYGENIIAALLTRGLAEITRLAVALSGRADTLAGLAGLGDLVLTSTGSLSRNRSLGESLGRGETLEGALEHLGMVAEGVRTTLAACRLAERSGVEMPIAVQMRLVLHEGKPPREAVDELMLRSLKRE